MVLGFLGEAETVHKTAALSNRRMGVRGRKYTPPPKTAIMPHILVLKSKVYSPDRLPYPRERFDFDPKGQRNPQNRGISGYIRITWDETL